MRNIAHFLVGGIIGSLILIGGFAAGNVLAAVRCETVYGVGEVCVRTGELQIDKEVFDPSTSKFVDNLGITTHRFGTGEEITFRLRIKNVGDATLNSVTVKDTLPSLLNIVSGSLDFEITDLAPGETEEREIKVRVASADRFPADKNLVCEVNAAEVTAGDERDRDTSQVCMEKKVLGVAVTPPTGPANWQFVFGFSLLFGIFGIYLTKVKNIRP